MSCLFLVQEHTKVRGVEWGGEGGGEVFIGIPEHWYDVPPPDVQRSDDEGGHFICRSC